MNSDPSPKRYSHWEAEAKSGLDSAMKEWKTAKESFKTGSLAEAVTKGNTVKEKAAQVLQILGMPVPAAAKS